MYNKNTNDIEGINGSMNNGGIIKQVIRYTVTSSGNYTKTLSTTINPNKVIVIVQGSGYNYSERSPSNTTYSGRSHAYSRDAYLLSITSSTVVTTCTCDYNPEYSVQVIEFY